MSRILLLLACFAALAAAQSVAPTTCKPGDGILLAVENEPALNDTFTVTPALTVVLPNVGEISVAGVARDALTTHFTKVLAKYLRRPTVTAKAMLRLAVVGEVARPGFYPIPVDVVFADALMAAGGPTKDAKVQDLYVQRSGKRVHGPAELRAALERNSTIGQVDLQSGDMITVPRRGNDTETWVRIIAMAVTIPLAVIGLSHAR